MALPARWMRCQLILYILGNAISWYRSEANMYRWLETFEQRHVEFQRYILYCQSMSRIWTSAANNISIDRGVLTTSETFALRARGLRQAAIFDDLKCLALARFSEVVHPGFFQLNENLAPLITDFRQDQLEWMSDLDIIRADLVCGLHFGLSYFS